MSDFNLKAAALIADGCLVEAREVLEEAVRGIPAGWTPTRLVESGRDGCRDKSLEIAFWDQEDFLAFVQMHRMRSEDEATVVWTLNSYSKAWYQLAVVEIEQKSFERALFCLDAGLKLESDHPALWNERGYVLQNLRRFEDALKSYVRAEMVRPWAPRATVARALRGQGSTLIDLNLLDAAAKAFRRSLEFDPESRVAKHELAYIDELNRGTAQNGKGEVKLPWFMHSFVNPPTDPLTLQLTALVGDLDSLEGPQTVGPENYARISEAFVERGWVGFEEEFDRAVPRSRSDYESIKRDLLRAPLFLLKVHHRMARVASGEITVEDALNEAKRDRRPPKTN